MPRIGLALSGGAARCIAHLGVLEIFNREGIPIDVISGTSGGGLVGALYASGRYTMADLIRHVSRLRWWDLTRPVLSRQGLLSSRRIGRYLHRWIGEMTFDQLALPLAVVATELSTGKKIVLQKGSVAQAVQASCSLPVLFEPTPFDGRLLVDGGFVSQIPVLAAREELEADFVVAVDVNYGGMDRSGPPNHIIKIAIHMASLWARKNAEEEQRLADFLVRVNVSGIGLTDLRYAKDLVERGRMAAREDIEELKTKILSLK